MTRKMAHWTDNTLRVYYAEQARSAYVLRTATTLDYVRHLKCDGGTYLASTRADYLALRVHEVSEPHRVETL